jgi:hypothetical protein
MALATILRAADAFGAGRNELARRCTLISAHGPEQKALRPLLGGDGCCWINIVRSVTAETRERFFSSCRR